MIPIPAVDISEGRAVRLEQGRFDRLTRFADDPLFAVARWVDAGASRVHLVDLDAARSGQPCNFEVIGCAVKRWPEVLFQVGGGIRNRDSVQHWLDIGVRFPVLGTAAVRDADFVQQAAEDHPGQIILAMDTRKGQVSISGWTQDSEMQLLPLAQRYADVPLAAILHTDIARDGIMRGPNLAASSELAQQQPHPVLISGGVRNLEDIQAIERAGLFAAAICGRALYEGQLDLAEALAFCAASGSGSDNE